MLLTKSQIPPIVLLTILDRFSTNEFRSNLARQCHPVGRALERTAPPPARLFSPVRSWVRFCFSRASWFSEARSRPPESSPRRGRGMPTPHWQPHPRHPHTWTTPSCPWFSKSVACTRLWVLVQVPSRSFLDPSVSNNDVGAPSNRFVWHSDLLTLPAFFVGWLLRHFPSELVYRMFCWQESEQMVGSVRSSFGQPLFVLHIPLRCWECSWHWMVWRKRATDLPISWISPPASAHPSKGKSPFE